MAAQTYTCGDTKTHALIVLAIAAIITYNGGDLSSLGGGVQTIEVYFKSGDYNEPTIDTVAGLSGQGVNDYIHLTHMQDHQGVAGNISVVNTNGGATFYCFLLGPYTRMDGFEITATAPGAARAIVRMTDGPNCWFYNNIIHDISSSNTAVAVSNYVLNARIYNNIVYNMTTVYRHQLGFFMGAQASGASYFYNNTAYNISSTDTYAAGFYGFGTQAATHIANNYAGSTTGRTWGGDFYGFAGNAEFKNNISADPTAGSFGGSDNQTSKAVIDQFVDLTPGSEDLHLKAGADCIDAGTDLSPIVVDDIIGTSRPRGVAYDVGAFEFTISGTPYYYYRRMRA